eukprot:scaffold11292_cov41-Phaeocystis_antarctica.AAC.2
MALCSPWRYLLWRYLLWRTSSTSSRSSRCDPPTISPTRGNSTSMAPTVWFGSGSGSGLGLGSGSGLGFVLESGSGLGSGLGSGSGLGLGLPRCRR